MASTALIAPWTCGSLPVKSRVTLVCGFLLDADVDAASRVSTEGDFLAVEAATWIVTAMRTGLCLTPSLSGKASAWESPGGMVGRKAAHIFWESTVRTGASCLVGETA